jgi:hypothetical protein
MSDAEQPNKDAKRDNAVDVAAAAAADSLDLDVEVGAVDSSDAKSLSNSASDIKPSELRHRGPDDVDADKPAANETVEVQEPVATGEDGEDVIVIKPATYGQLFKHFLILGCIAFGGPAAHIAYFQKVRTLPRSAAPPCTACPQAAARPAVAAAD